MLCKVTVARFTDDQPSDNNADVSEPVFVEEQSLKQVVAEAMKQTRTHFTDSVKTIQITIERRSKKGVPSEG